MKKLQGLAAIVLLSAGMAFGQSQNGTVSGVITDASGAVVSGATVTLKSVETGLVRTVTTNGAGNYEFPGVAPQHYKITVVASSFATTTTDPIEVTVGSESKVNAKLSVRSESTQIEVAADSFTSINLQNSEQSQLITTEQILQLPSETRNPYDFVALSGNISSDPSGASRGVGYNISGARDSSTDILLDGTENTYNFSVGVASVVPLDAVQEYRVITSNFGPEYGRASGGVVNVLTKSGTNRFHGTGYEFYRPSTFASNSYYNNANGIPQHRFVRNNFGYSVGGPVFRDKLFFFSNTEWLRIRSSNVIQYYVPTAAFIGASDPATQAFFAKFGALSAPTTGKTLAVSQLASVGFTQDSTQLPTLNPGLFTPGFAVAQQVNVTVPIDAGGGTPGNTWNTIGRLDYNLTDKTQMYGRYVYFTNTNALGSGNASPYAGYSTSNTTLSHNALFGITHTFSSALTSQLQLSFLRINVNQPLGANPAGPTLYINGSSSPTISGGGQFVFPGYSEGSAGSGLPSGGPQNDLQVSPVVTYTKGRHTFTIGGQYTYIRDNHTFGIYENATESLVQAGTSYTDPFTKAKQGALSNFYRGQTAYFQANLYPQGEYPCIKSLTTGATPGTNGAPFNPACTLTTPIAQPVFSRSNRYNESAAFFNDAWKASPRLTINAGLRYELYGTQHNKNPNLDSNFYFGTSGTLQDRIRAGKILRTTDTAPAGVQQPNGKLWVTNYKQFAPRIGFAYDLTGDGKTSLRGGYGISYERNFGNVTYNIALNPPNAAAVSLTTADTGGPYIPISTGVLGNFSGAAGVQKALSPTTLRAVNPNIAPAYNQFYTLALERQVTPSTTVSASFVGERGIHNYSIANYNRSYYGQVYENDPALYTAAVGSPSKLNNVNRLNPQYTSINVRGADGDSYYDSVNLGLRTANAFHSGVSASLNYTYAHSTDNTSSTFTDGQSNTVNSVAYFDPYNKALDHGNSDFDVKHRITVGLVWQVPFFSHFTGLSKTLLDGFSVAPVFTANTGTPFSMYDEGQNVATVYPRARFLQKPNYQRVGNGRLLGNDDFSYIDFPAYGTAGAYGSYADPKVGFADLPTIVNGQDTFPGGMSARNAFRGPGQMNGINATVAKNFAISERLSVQLRAEAYDLLNHANSYLILGGNNDVELGNIQYQKNGPAAGGNRQLQLAGKIIF